MPIYEYVCSKCDGEFEIIHGMSENPKTKCPECGGRMKRQVSLGAFHLKGSGWYKDGYASGNNGKTAADTGGGESDKKGKSEGKKAETSNKEKGKSESTKSSAPAAT
jgi:putative FmdB family regulatory protein